MDSLHKYIRSYFGFAQSDLDKVASLFVETKLKKGDFFLKTHQYCTRLSFLHSGYLRFYALQNDKEVTQWIASEGSFVTELSSFVFGKRSRFDIQALSNCVLYTIDLENYKRLNDLISNWQEIEKRFISSCFVMLENRMFAHLSMSAEERYNMLYIQNKALFANVPQQYIASMLGMTPETFSRIRKKSVS